MTDDTLEDINSDSEETGVVVPDTAGTVVESGERIIIDGEQLREAQAVVMKSIHQGIRSRLRTRLQDHEGKSRDTPLLYPSMDTSGVEDSEWIADLERRGVHFALDQHGDKLLDINVSEYEKLPPSWRKFYEDRAKTVVELVADDINVGNVLNELRVQELSALIYDQWIQETTDLRVLEGEDGRQECVAALNSTLVLFGLRENPLDELRQGREPSFRARTPDSDGIRSTNDRKTGGGWDAVKEAIEADESKG